MDLSPHFQEEVLGAHASSMPSPDDIRLRHLREAAAGAGDGSRAHLSGNPMPAMARTRYLGCPIFPAQRRSRCETT